MAKSLAKYVPAVMYVLLATSTLTLAWAIQDLWPSPESCTRAVTAAKTYYRTGTLISFMFAAIMVWQRRSLPPEASGLRGIFRWFVAAALVWALMHAAALLALPAAG